MSQAKFPKMLDYEKLKQQFGEQQADPTVLPKQSSAPHFTTPTTNKSTEDHHVINHECAVVDNVEVPTPPQGLTGTRLRSYAFAVLTRKEYSKVDLIEKLSTWAQDKNEVIALVEELAENHYQSDQRVAEMTVRSQLRKGKGPNRIKLALRTKHLNKDLVQEDLAEIDWYTQAYQLKVKKYGSEVARDPKVKAKQIRFLQYRGFEMDAIMKAISRKSDDD